LLGQSEGQEASDVCCRHLRWLAPVFAREGAAQAAEPRVRPLAQASAVTAAIASLVLGLASGAIRTVVG